MQIASESLLGDEEIEKQSPISDLDVRLCFFNMLLKLARDSNLTFI